MCSHELHDPGASLFSMSSSPAMAKQQRKNRAGSSASDGADADADAAATARLKPMRAWTRKSAPRDQCPSRRTSAHRGVTRHRWTGRFEAHLWDKDAWSETQMNKKKTKKKGRQVYLGAYGDEEAAARAYDLAALKYWGRGTLLNFPLSSYDEELREMEGQSREEYIGSLRRKSTGFSRGVSKYRGVARHHHNGKWEARIGRVFGNKYLYLGTYATQEEAAMAYDIAAIQHRGLNAVTNFDVSRYIKWRHHHSSCRAVNADDGLEDTNRTPGQQLFGDLAQHPTIDLDEAMAASESSTGSASSSSCSPSTPPPLTTQQQQQPEYSGGASSARRSFPDDVQTYFGHDDDDYGVDFAEVDTFLFGDLGTYAAPMFQFELDV